MNFDHFALILWHKLHNGQLVLCFQLQENFTNRVGFVNFLRWCFASCHLSSRDLCVTSHKPHCNTHTLRNYTVTRYSVLTCISYCGPSCKVLFREGNRSPSVACVIPNNFLSTFLFPPHEVSLNTPDTHG